MSVFNAMNISATGMTAQRLRLDTISQNIANADTTKTDNGGPYRRKIVTFEEITTNNSFGQVFNSYLNNDRVNGGVKVSKISDDESPFNRVYNPTHPNADKEGYVLMPNVNTLEEMTNMISTNRSYEANIAAFNATKSMISKAMELGK